MQNLVIAIDGPAASGKSTTARMLAEKLEYVYIDTGAMYRACAVHALKHGVKIEENDDLKKLLANIRIEIRYRKEGNQVLLNGDDVSARIRQEDISRLSSEIAVIGFVRRKLVELQRAMAERGGVIMDGRDIGTVVLPHADLKIYMIADVGVRAERRQKELHLKGIETDFATVKKELEWRDYNDSHREMGPLKKAEDAIELNTTFLSIDEQVERILNIIKENK